MRTKEELLVWFEGRIEDGVIKDKGLKKKFEEKFGVIYDYAYLESAMEKVLEKRVLAFLSSELDRLPDHDFIALMDLMSKPNETKVSKKQKA